jgi:WD40 repeat protein
MVLEPVKLAAGRNLWTLEGHSSAVMSVAFLHHPIQLASGSRDSTIKIWDTSSSVCVQTLQDHVGPITSVAFSHDSTQLASASRDNTIRIWDASSGACLKTFSGHTMWVRCIAISSNSIRLASASEDRAVKILGYQQRRVPADTHGPYWRGNMSCLLARLGPASVSLPRQHHQDMGRRERRVSTDSKHRKTPL